MFIKEDEILIKKILQLLLLANMNSCLQRPLQAGNTLVILRLCSPKLRFLTLGRGVGRENMELPSEIPLDSSITNYIIMLLTTPYKNI